MSFRFPLHVVVRRFLLAPVILFALICAGRSAQAQSTGVRYTNLVNQKFATVSSGSQSAISVDVAAGADDATVRDAVTKRLKATWAVQSATMSRSVALMEKSGFFKTRGSAIPISTLIQVRENGVPVTRAWKPTTRAVGVGGGTLTFKYTGWAAQDQATIQQLITAFYPRIVALYGQPAVSSEVEIFNLGTFDNNQGTQVQRLAFGGYDVSNNRILLPIYDSNETFAEALLLNLIHAFHGPAVFQYDAWEQGFARAAASIIARTPDFGFDDPSANNLFELLKWYDLLNQPGLGNSTFFPPSQANIDLTTTAGGFTLGKMTFPRMGMSGAAWLKVYIENPNFFLQFNAAYYAQFDPTATPSLAGNVPALKTIAAALLPNGVESVDFNDWYSQQYILDTSISPGRKLYAIVIPGLFTTSGGQANLIEMEYFQTLSTGDESLLNGTVYATYHDSTGARINLGVASESTALADGEGSITTESFQSDGRITMDFAVGAETTRTYFSGGLTGDTQAAVLGPLTDSLKVTVNQTTSTANRSQTATITNGAFAVNLGMTITDLARTVIQYTDANGLSKTFVRNIGDAQAYLVLAPDQNGGAVTTANLQFAVGTVPYLVSFPVRPLSTDISTALGLNISDYLLTYWDPVKSAYATAVSDPTTSIQPIIPGRGYWFKLEPADLSISSVNLQLTGVPPVTDTDFAIAAPYGWNMIGTPFTNGVTNVTDILVQYLQNDAIAWSDAVTQNLVAAQPYRYDRTSGQFVLTPTIDGTQWQGVFLRVLVPGTLTLLLPAPNETTRAIHVSRSAAVTTPRPDWSVTLRSTQASDPKTGTFGRVATATFGAASNATDGYDNLFDREEPPAVLPGVGLAFSAPTTGSIHTAGGRFVADFRAANRNNTWNLTSMAVVPGPVQLSWENLSSVPRTTQLTLTDNVTGTSIPLGSRSSYSWTATDTIRTRSFTITSQPGKSLPLMLTNLLINRAPGRAANGGQNFSISYNVTTDAQVSVQLSTLTGKVVQTVEGSGRAVSAGRQTLMWDGRAAGGSALPAGTYMMRITATSTDGSTTVTALRPVLMLN